MTLARPEFPSALEIRPQAIVSSERHCLPVRSQQAWASSRRMTGPTRERRVRHSNTHHSPRLALSDFQLLFLRQDYPSKLPLSEGTFWRQRVATTAIEIQCLPYWK